MQKARVRKLQKTKDDNSFIVNKATLIRFMNKGQTIVWIDEQETLLPGEAYIETTAAPLDHSYKIDFLQNPNAPAANQPQVYAGNFLKIRIIEIDDRQ